MITRLGRSAPRILDLDSLEDFDRRARRATVMRGWHLYGLDLSERAAELARLDPGGAVLVDCLLPAGALASLRSRGAYVVEDGVGVAGAPDPVPDAAGPAPVPPLTGEGGRRPARKRHFIEAERSSLYTPAELYEGLGAEGGAYEEVPDARVYAWARQHLGVSGEDAALADDSRKATRLAALHDHSIAAALHAAVQSGPLSGRPLVGVMGGHGADRGTPDYAEAAHLGRALYLAGARVATGGGPGAMEAANLGAYLAGAPGADLDEELAALAAVPSPSPDPAAWAMAGFGVLERHPAGGEGLGVPTWFYGHEPPNVFATRIAKYFSNAQREAVLLVVASGGTVVMPGAAGTVQEIFQEACEGYYGAKEKAAPLVLWGSRYWTETLPAWPLLLALSRDSPLEGKVHLVDSVPEALAALGLCPYAAPVPKSSPSA